jgi:protein-S-isoprenylcysteine O-methyltransferase Ste14
VRVISSITISRGLSLAVSCFPPANNTNLPIRRHRTQSTSNLAAVQNAVVQQSWNTTLLISPEEPVLGPMNQRCPLPIPPPILALVLILVAWLLCWYLPVARFGFPHQKLFGELLLLVGFGIGFSAWLIFVQRKTPLRPGQPPRAFVESGPYWFTRNPMYLGAVIFMLGLFFLSRSWYFLIPPVLFFGIIHFVLIPFEEELMRETFGDSYLDYCRRVRRWI